MNTKKQMKALFLIFHGFNEANGISKKIHYQVKALKDCGVDSSAYVIMYYSLWQNDVGWWSTKLIGQILAQASPLQR